MGSRHPRRICEYFERKFVARFFCTFSKERFRNSSDTRARPGDSSQEIEDLLNVSKQFGKPPSQSSGILVLQEVCCSPYVQPYDAGANLP